MKLEITGGEETVRRLRRETHAGDRQRGRAQHTLGKEEGQGERGEARQAEKGRIVRGKEDRERAVDREREREQHTETKEETKRPIRTRDRNRQQDTAETEPGQPAL